MAKIKFKDRKFLAKLKVRRILKKDAAAANVAHEALGPVSLERVICLLEEARALHEKQQAYDAGKKTAAQDGGGIWDGTTAVASSSLERIISNAFVGSALELNALTASMGNMAIQQAPRDVERGRYRSFFAMNAPQGNPFAAAGAANVPFPPNLQQQPFTGQHFGPPAPLWFRKVSNECARIFMGSTLAPLPWSRIALFRKTLHLATQTASDCSTRDEVPAAMAVDLASSPRALVALESQLVRLCEICTVCLGLNGVQVNAYSVELAHSFELRLQRNRDFDG
ncbi:meiosis mei2 [Fusarium mundagurra]|uniref:Meiosis mei2 n=1 Tax=Fusarium mundagurra TaxID=1567541 RepID=A0A8H5YQU8_9HYPO|nr:meiosis mei2 [Fusarium mundagurra]